MANDPNRRARGGSAKILVGRCYHLALFVSSTDTSWTVEEKNYIHVEEKKALEWLLAQALDYGVDLSFEYGVFPSKVPHDPWSEVRLPSCPQGLKWLKAILPRYGYRDPADLYRYCQQTYSCQNVHAVIYTKGLLTKGFSMPFFHGLPVYADTFFESAIVPYRADARSRHLYAGSIAHEVLHLYGAWDFHHSTSTGSEGSEKQARQRFPKDIMLWPWPLHDRIVGPVTAYTIGWTQTLPPYGVAMKPTSRAYS